MTKQTGKSGSAGVGFQNRLCSVYFNAYPIPATLIFTPKSRIILPEENRATPYRPNQRNYFKGFDSILMLSIPGVPEAAQKPIVTRVPEGTMSALTE